MTPIEIIALFIIALGLIKIIIILFNPNTWMRFVEWVYSYPKLTQIIAFILAGLTFYYLIQEITLIQIFAVMAFMAFFIMAGIAPYMKTILKDFKKIINKRNIWKDFWFYTLIWLILLIYGLRSLIVS